MYKSFLAVVAAIAAASISYKVVAQEIVLKAASAFDQGSAYSRAFERFVDFVNAEGKGHIRINYVGGGSKIMSVFEMGNALKTGVFDVLNINSAFYSNLMPEADAIKLAHRSLEEQRKDGSWDYLQNLLNQKVNAYLLAQSKGNVPFHFYLRKGAKPISSAADLRGMKFRATPIYHAFLIELGVTPIRMVPNDIYTGMERGVVDGYGWPIQGIDELGLVPVTAYRIDPGFFVGSDELLVNLDVWKKLNPRQKEILTYAAAWLESWLPMYEKYENEEAKRMQAQVGIKVLELKGDEAKKYLETGYKAAWEQVLKASPEHGPKLKALLDR